MYWNVYMYQNPLDFTLDEMLMHVFHILLYHINALNDTIRFN